jgi:probable addiction module antidote protein
MPAYLLEALMPQRSPRKPIRPQPGGRELTDHINCAFGTSDIDEIRHAIGAAIRLYNVSDIAKASGLERPTIYRAFEGDAQHPNFRTVLSVLDALGFQLHVTVGRDARARLARPKAVPSGLTERHE